MSDKFSLTVGISEGSILGATLFLIFCNDFEDNLNVSKSVQFTDETFICYSGKSITNIEEKLNRDLSSISKYLKCNELIINLDKNKTEAMLFELLNTYSYTLNNLNYTMIKPN